MAKGFVTVARVDDVPPGSVRTVRAGDEEIAVVHVAVAWYQAGRGNRVGCERQLEKAARRLAAYGPRHEGVDVASVLEQVRAAADVVCNGSLELAPPRL